MTPGKAFEDEVLATASAYEQRGLLFLRKVEPPTKVLWKGGRPIVILCRNPFLDFIGSWTERGGRTLVLEAKSTREPRLPFGGESGGITEDQIRSMASWCCAGAAGGVLWRWWGPPAKTAFVSPFALRDRMRGGRKSLAWDPALELPAGLGMALFDWLPALAEAFPAHAQD